MKGWVLFDCDSTLSAIEGVDELARLRGEEVFREVEAATRAAMDGGVPLESIFGMRLERIRPTVADVAAIGRLYLRHIEPSAEATVRELRGAGWRIGIVSGGFTRAIRPLADHLGIERVEAVELHFDAEGFYTGFNPDSPTARSGGKNAAVRALRSETGGACPIILVGDGASDLEARPDVDLFVGFGGYVDRPRVRAGAEVFITALSALPPILQARFGR
jgi:phosphoserine phosphatase